MEEYKIGETVQVRLKVWFMSAWYTCKVIGWFLDRSTSTRTYNVKLEDGRVIGDITPDNLRKG